MVRQHGDRRASLCGKQNMPQRVKARMAATRWKVPKVFVKMYVCAWCRQHGYAQSAVRPSRAHGWHVVSHAFVRAATQAGLASHGVCGRCKNRLIDDLAPADSRAA